MSSLEIFVDYLAGMSRLAKATRCRVDGIGADLVPTLFGAHENQLIGTATLHVPPGADSPNDQLRYFTDAAALMRTGWSVTSLGLLFEAFVGVGEARDLDNLAGAFAQGNPDVHECLLIVGALADNAVVCALPYRYGLGRTVTWGEPLSEAAVPEMAGPYLGMLVRVLESPTVPMPSDTESAINAVADMIADVGFVVQTFDDVEVSPT